MNFGFASDGLDGAIDFLENLFDRRFGIDARRRRLGIQVFGVVRNNRRLVRGDRGLGRPIRFLNFLNSP